jgi:hypothetical protein
MEPITIPNRCHGFQGFLYQHARFTPDKKTINTQVFQTITTDCRLKRPSAHQDCALVVSTMIRVLAYTLTMVFYYRSGPQPLPQRLTRFLR